MAHHDSGLIEVILKQVLDTNDYSTAGRANSPRLPALPNERTVQSARRVCIIIQDWLRVITKGQEVP